MKIPSTGKERVLWKFLLRQRGYIIKQQQQQQNILCRQKVFILWKSLLQACPMNISAETKRVYHKKQTNQKTTRCRQRGYILWQSLLHAKSAVEDTVPVLLLNIKLGLLGPPPSPPTGVSRGGNFYLNVRCSLPSFLWSIHLTLFRDKGVGSRAHWKHWCLSTWFLPNSLYKQFLYKFGVYFYTKVCGLCSFSSNICMFDFY